jgi:plasmid maintenance system antidote protein VapI
MDGKDQHPLIEEAIDMAGSQAELATRCGCAQQHISKLLNREVSITAEMAVKIEKATEGKIPRWRARPDLWAPVSSEAAEWPAQSLRRRVVRHPCTAHIAAPVKATAIQIARTIHTVTGRSDDVCGSCSRRHRGLARLGCVDGDVHR